MIQSESMIAMQNTFRQIMPLAPQLSGTER